MIDFNAIRSGTEGKRRSFEELVCQLARREPPDRALLFRRVEGAGGDGGVEAYWQLSDKTEIGYQAKFFLRPREIDWRQIDRSVQDALKTHPSVIEYVVAIPCNLTDRTGKRSTARTGWQQWATHKGAWEKQLSATGRTVNFIIWTAFDLQIKLALPTAEGLRRYWFQDLEFSRSWFKSHVSLATASLDERYHPEDHVDVSIQQLFSYLSRDASARRDLSTRIAEIKTAYYPDRLQRLRKLEIPASSIEAAESTLHALAQISANFETPPWQEWDLLSWQRLTERAIDQIAALQTQLRDAKRETPKDNPRPAQEREYTRYELDKIASGLGRFNSLIRGRYLAAETHRAALVEGRAGTGKSHLLGRIAERAAEQGQPVLLLLGQQLRDAPLWDQIRSRFGLGTIGADTLLDALDAAAEAECKRGLILVDAINEGAGARLWYPEVAEFLARVKRRPNLACVIACRTEYIPYAIPKELLDSIPRFVLCGFQTASEQRVAARMYMDKRGIARPSVPWLAPEFVNPLFLRSLCLALNRDGKTEFPRGLTGTKAIFRFYAKSAARHLGAGRDGSEDLVRPTLVALNQLALAMVERRADFASVPEASKIADSAFSEFPPPPGQRWLDVLHRSGLLRRDPDPSFADGDPLAMPADVIRYQRFQDHLIADALLSKVRDITVAFMPGEPLAFLCENQTTLWQWHGVLESLSIQTAERFSHELVDVLPEPFDTWWRQPMLRDAFAESVLWRDKKAFTDRTLELFNRLARTHVDTLSLLVELSASVDHPWNADFLDKNLRRRKRVQRDTFWTAWSNSLSTGGEDAVGRLIDWCLFGQTDRAERAMSMAVEIRVNLATF
jgi:hypothetical protein